MLLKQRQDFTTNLLAQQQLWIRTILGSPSVGLIFSIIAEHISSVNNIEHLDGKFISLQIFADNCERFFFFFCLTLQHLLQTSQHTADCKKNPKTIKKCSCAK